MKQALINNGFADEQIKRMIKNVCQQNNIQPKLNRINFETRANVLKCFSY